LFPGKSNNEMIKLMMDLKGKIPNKVLKRGKFSEKHFDIDDSFAFLQTKTDLISGEEVVRSVIVGVKPVQDIKAKIGGEGGELERDFIDFLERSLVIVPERRMTIQEAIRHPFISPKAKKGL
jgi:serine/threonine-protein kinase PRP4